MDNNDVEILGFSIFDQLLEPIFNDNELDNDSLQLYSEHFNNVQPNQHKKVYYMTDKNFESVDLDNEYTGLTNLSNDQLVSTFSILH